MAVPATPQSPRRASCPSTTIEALTALDPWWNPPWPYNCTPHRQQYRTLISGTSPSL
ncbi:hypothetical protein ACOBQB_10745 [Streptomyces sp. G5(2025)]|uniref:hypothetical protein n=1 Tax=Streptomyces sp. G5(2025) TaxID=3406628 RepID=UPI003C21B944